jgi:Rrf2 family protein
MAAAPPGEAVTAAGVALRHGLPPAVVAKVFQRLSRAGLAAGTRGVAGGYRLARAASSITVLEVMEACESLAPAGPGTHSTLPATGVRLRELFDEIDEQARATLASVTLATLVRPRQALALVSGERPGRR